MYNQYINKFTRRGNAERQIKMKKTLKAKFEERKAKKEAMLAAMTPEERKAYDDEMAWKELLQTLATADDSDD